VLLDRKIETPSVVVTGLPVGAYYWSIQSYDAAGKESVESEKNRFTIVVKTKEKIELSLDLDPFVQHGHVIEVSGKTEAGARVMVNGKEVPIVGDDGAFRYFNAATAERGKPGHGHGAELQRWGEYPPGESGHSINNRFNFQGYVCRMFGNNRVPKLQPVLLNIQVE